MVYKNCRIVTSEEVIHGWLEIDDNGNIKKISAGENTTGGYDCQNKIIMPGFIDTHTHGGYGMSFDDFKINDEFFNLYEKYLTNISSEGVVAFVPTNVSLSLERLYNITDQVSLFINEHKNKFSNFPKMVAWYFEGPFINVNKKGAHDERVLIPVCEKFLNYAKEKINIPIICAIAPEINNNEIIKKFQDDFIFALGHSNANYEQTVEAFKSGVKRVIHLYNAMSGFSHRDTGIVNAVFNHEYNEKVAIEIISDGVHVDNKVIKTTNDIVCKDNITIVSDCLAQKGLIDDDYMLGTLAVQKKGNWFYLKDSNTLAGGGSPYSALVANYKKSTNCSLTDLVKFSSLNSAKNLGLESYGKLDIGSPANFVLVDDEINVYKTIVNGKEVYSC
ncbi:MAG: amidohydrolase family protein [Mycoplasma sp.]